MFLNELVEMYAYAMIMAIIVLSSITSGIMDKLFGVGVHPVLSTIIGSAAGIIILLISPSLVIVSAIVAVVVTIAASLIQDKIL